MSEPYGEVVTWQPDRPRIRPLHTLIGWAVSAASVYVAAWILPGLTLHQTGAAFLAAAAIAVLNAILPPILASLRLPFMVAFGFLLVLFADAFLLMLAADALPDHIEVSGFGDALLAALVMSAVSLTLEVILGTDDDDEYSLRVIRRIARRQGGREPQRRAGDHLPRDRRARAARAARRDARRQRHHDGPLGGRARLPHDRVGDRPVVADRREPGRHPARLQRRHPRVPLGREGGGADARLLGARRLRRDRAPASRRASACWPTAARAAATCSPARPTRRSSPSAASRRRSAPTPATGRSSPTASTSRACSCCSCSRSRSR